MKNLDKFKSFSFILSIFLISSFLVGFTDYFAPKYTMMNNVVIKRNNDGALYMKGRIYLKFKNNVTNFSSKSFGIGWLDKNLSDAGLSEIKQSYPLNPNKRKRMIGDEELAKIFLIKYDGNTDPSELAQQIFDENRNILDWAEPDFVYVSDFTPNDPYLGSQYHISKISSYTAWDITQGDTNVVIGMVDTGSDLDHPDLAANIKYNYADPVNGIDDDANGYVDDWRGWDFAGANYQSLSQDNDPNIYGSNCDHGSHTSGDASEVTNNGVGGAGIGFKCKLLISKHGADNDYTGGGVSYLYNTNSGITYCYQNGAKVINCSFGSPTFSAQQELVINNAFANGTIVVASAGNDGLNVPRYPASYDNAVSVAATNASDVKAYFSNYHTTVDVCAPGQGIYSTLWNNTYASYDGTSMSAPIVSGVVALIRSKFPALTAQEVVNKLKAGVDDIYAINPAYIGLLGTGRVNAYKCVLGTGLSANFTASQTSISPGQSVNFTDQSTGGPTGWSWSFPGGTPSTSTQQNPTGIVYNTVGSYSVTLTVTGPGGPSTLTKNDYISVSYGSVTLLNESFENAGFPPAGWTKQTPTGATGWNRQLAGTTPIPGFTGGTLTVPADGGTAVAFCNYITGSANGGSSGPSNQWLITPQISNIQTNDSLTFWLRKFGSYIENFEVKISTTTPTVAAMTIPVMSQNYSVNDSGWVQYKYRIGNLVPPGSNIYIGFREWVNDVAADGATFSMDIVKVTRPGTLGISSNTEIPSKYDLNQNYPNPFNPSTVISYSLMKNGFVSLKVYDVQGREVSTLVNEYKPAGNYDVTFSSNSSISLPSGVYFYKLISGDFSAVKKMTLIK